MSLSYYPVKNSHCCSYYIYYLHNNCVFLCLEIFAKSLQKRYNYREHILYLILRIKYSKRQAPIKSRSFEPFTFLKTINQYTFTNYMHLPFTPQKRRFDFQNPIYIASLSWKCDILPSSWFFAKSNKKWRIPWQAKSSSAQPGGNPE